MSPHPTSIDVEEGWLSARLVWPDPDMTPVALEPWWKWLGRNLDLYDGTVDARISAIAGLDNVVQGLALLAKNGDGQILPITGGKIADAIPWEALDRRFVDTSLLYHPVRADGTVTAVPADRPSPLRVALLVGHEGPNDTFVRDRELSNLKNAFRASAQISARIVDANALAMLDLTAGTSANDRRAFFADVDPHVVFYFGHGKAGDTPALRIGPARADWLPIQELAGYASNEHPFPATWVFIACSIGESPSHETGPAGPEAFRILAQRGARTMLAMRARIRPQIARTIAASLIESLSAGTPLELAAAIARKTARRARENAKLTMVDWAAPAVWSTVVGPMPPRGASVPPEMVTTKLTRAAADDPGIGLTLPDGIDVSTTTRLAQETQIRLDISDEDHASTVALLAKIAGAIGMVSGRPSLFVNVPGSMSFTARLAEWAAAVLPTLDYVERESTIGRAVRQLANRDLEGLESILGVPGIAVIFSAPPGISDSTAWTLLEDAGADKTIIIGYASVNQEQRPGWTLDRVMADGAMRDTLETLARYPETLALLVVLDGPANLEAVSMITGEPSAEVAAAGLTISMPSGVVLTGGARSTIRARVPAEAIIRAHRRAFEARRRIPALIESDDVFAPVRDLVGAHSPELTPFVNALAINSCDRWTENDWIALARALEPARNQWGSFDSWILLRIADALAGRQRLPQAKLWLDQLESDDSEIDAGREYLLSEVAKAGGTTRSRERMWQHARTALRRLEEAVAMNTEDRRLRARIREMRGNLARLELYFNHNALAAENIFTGILYELNGQDETHVAPSLVATLRNLAECLFEFEPFRSPENRTEARRHLVRAAEVAQRNHLGALGAEALYSTAKLDEVESDWAAARDHLVATAERARSAGHAVCLRIAEMRMFWLGVRHEHEPFDYAIFSVRLRRLEFLESHAWARRYAAQSRLWAAHELDRAGDQLGMRSLLQRTIESFEPLRTLSSNADRRSVALSHAGLATSEAAATGGVARDQESWQRFNALDWVLDWIEQYRVNDPSEYWRGDA
jgi:hypothetical protein